MHYSKYVVLGKVSKEVSLDELSRSLKPNSIVSCDDRPIGLVTHWDLVFFARTWAGWALEERGEKPPPSALEALSLVDKWLQDPGSVSSKELWAAWAAAEAAGAAAEAAEAARAAGAAARAAGAAAWAAGAAAEAAGAAAGAAGAAAGAAEAAARAADVASFRKQGEFIIEHLKNSSKSLWRLA